MTYKSKLRIFLLTVVIAPLVVIQSCYKDPFDFDKLAKTSWSPDLAAPVVHSRLTLLKLLDVGKLDYSADASNFLTLLYRDTVYSPFGHEMFEIPNQTFDTNFFFPLPTLMPGDSVTKTYNFKHALKTQGPEIIDSLVFLEGFYRFKLTGNLNHDAIVTIRIPNLTKNGIEFKRVLNYPYNGYVPNTVVIEYDLTGYKYVFNKVSPTVTELSEILTINAFIGNEQIKSPYILSIRKEIHSTKFEKIHGYLGWKNYDLGDDKFNFSIFDNNQTGSMFLEDPRFNIHFYNSYGMPVLISLPTLNVQRDNTTMPITSSLLGQLHINAPSLAQIGDYEVTSYTFDQSNSNVKDAFNLMPRHMNYKITGLANPSGQGIGTHNFCLHDSRFFAILEAEFPLFGRAMAYTLIDTTTFSFEDDANIEFIEMRIHASSMLPAEAKLQIIFADSNDVTLDSLFTEPSFVIRAASPGPPPDYRVNAPVKNSVTIVLNRDKLNSLANTHKLYIKANVSTLNSGNQSVKLYSDYAIDVNVGVRAKYKVEF